MADQSQIKSIFLAAIEKPSAERAAFLIKATGANAALRARVEALLQAHDSEGTLLKSAGTMVNPTVDHRDEAAITESPGQLIGPYKLLQQIGEGGMGIVFMAEQTHPVERRVALKIIKPGMDTQQVIARFEAERQALAMMDHPNIAHVLDAGATDTGRPFFVMELVKGVPITSYCDEKRLPIRERLELIVPVCRAVEHAHQKGIIHRDVKPSNVLVAEYDNHAIPKVIDFGVAKATVQKLTDRTMFTEFGQIIGTVEYMSPEQAKFNQLDIDTRSDVYSLGVLLYELLTGSTPFDRRRLHDAAFDEVLRIIREEEPPKPSTRLSSSQQLPAIAASRHAQPAQLNKEIRGELDWIVMRSLEKDRNRRYQSAGALADDLERYFAQQPVEACPPSLPYRFKKFVRRNQVATLAAAAVVLSLLVGVTATTWLYLRERDARRQAELATAREMQLRIKQEASSTIYQARFLTRNREPDAAERELDKVPPLIKKLEPHLAGLVSHEVGTLRAEQNRWTDSAASFLHAIAFDPDHFEHYHWCIPALVRAKEHASYDNVRQQMFRQFGNTQNPRVAERIVKDCLILPWPGADFPAINRLADLALAATEPKWARGYFQFAKSLAEYRQGRYESAIHFAQLSLQRPTEDINRTAQAHIVEAMAWHQLGEHEKARFALAEGQLTIRQTLPAESRLIDYIGWNDWVLAHALEAEAVATIGDVQ